VVPGLDGGGESCLHLVLPVVRPAGGPPPATVWLVDTRAATEGSLDEVIDTVSRLLGDALAGRREVTCWTQSFGAAVLALVLQRRPFDVGRLVLVSPFTRLAAWKVRSARVVTALTPTPLYRRAIPPLARVAFGPPGDDPDFPFFAGLARGTSTDLARRMGWLVGADFAPALTALPAVPTGVWFGARDRLIDRHRERDFFGALARSSGAVSVVPDAGHVIVPTAAVDQARREIAEWLPRS
jgi:pimeloyl-ACP methyl ester carboxylesterase